jgi:hypothetical protein
VGFQNLRESQSEGHCEEITRPTFIF